MRTAVGLFALGAGSCIAVAVGSIAGCTVPGEVGVDDGGAGGGDDGGGDGGQVMDASSLDGGCSPLLCQTRLYACGNCVDDDGDGLSDAADPDCLGPCHNDEARFHLNIPGGDARPCALDCYFDQDQGSGNDHCEWDHRCDPLEPDHEPVCRYREPPPAEASCPTVQEEGCGVACGPLTPNGCDCFGCCNLPAGSDRYVFIGSTDTTETPTCDLASISDPERCHPCTPVADCLNDCGRCELCVGRVALPTVCAEASDGGIIAGDRCSPGVQACGEESDLPCGVGYYCLTGCCIYFG